MLINAFLIVVTALQIATIIAIGSAADPLIGHDFAQSLIWSFDHFVHMRVNGFWDVQTYSPMFGAGLPVWANPQSLQFSLPTFLLYLLPPLPAVWTAIGVMHAAGNFFCYRMLRVGTDFSRLGAAIGALSFGASSFYLSHMIVGHVYYHAWPLLSLFLWALLHPRLPRAWAVAGSTLAMLSNFYAGGLHILILIAASLPIIFLTYGLLAAQPLPFGEWAWRLAATTGWTLTLCLSKLVAMLAFLDQFPRKMGHWSLPEGQSAIAAILWQYLGLPVARGYDQLTNSSSGSPANNPLQASFAPHLGLWELDLGIPVVPIVLSTFVLCYFTVVGARRSYAGSWRQLPPLKATFVAMMVGYSYLLCCLVLGRGATFDLLRSLPILDSYVVMPRFSIAWLVPICMLTGWALTRLEPSTKAKRRWFFVTALSCLSVVLHSTSYWQEHAQANVNYTLTFPREWIDTPYKNFRDSISSAPTVKEVSQVADYEAYARGVSSLKVYQPMFGYDGELFKTPVRPGPALDVLDGAFNFHNPASFVFPGKNGPPFSRVGKADEERLRQFLAREDPAWPEPWWQTAAHAITMLGWVASIMWIVWRIGFSAAGDGGSGIGPHAWRPRFFAMPFARRRATKSLPDNPHHNNR